MSIYESCGICLISGASKTVMVLTKAMLTFALSEPLFLSGCRPSSTSHVYPFGLI